jgi:hypothetical protein
MFMQTIIFSVVYIMNKSSSKTRSKKGSRKSNSKTRSKRGGTKRKKEAEICPICLEELKKGEQIPKLNCKHKFHKACLEPLCTEHGKVPCPLCRGDIRFACAAEITRDLPWEYNEYNSSSPFTPEQRMHMSAKERQQMYKEEQKHRNNRLARRRRMMRTYTPQEREQYLANEYLELTGENLPQRRGDEQVILRSPDFPPPRSPDFPPPRSPDFPPPRSPARSPARSP